MSAVLRGFPPHAVMITSWPTISHDVVVQAEAGGAVVWVEGAAGIFASDRAKCADHSYPDVGPIPVRACCDGDIHSDRSGFRRPDFLSDGLTLPWREMGYCPP